MKQFFADLHIHVGMSSSGWVKIPSSKALHVCNILDDAFQRKGLDIIGIVDAMSPYVMHDLDLLLAAGCLRLLSGGGYSYKEQVTLLLGAEVETVEDNGRAAHVLVFLPDLAMMKKFSAVMAGYIRNIHLSSQNTHLPLRNLIGIASDFAAIIVPAHIFTPFKGIYGACTNSLTSILSDKELACIAGVELGLSADTDLADRIRELAPLSFLTNSDAHSLGKIAREYNVLEMEEGDFRSVMMALARKEGCRISANYGISPLLGKYHSSFCAACDRILPQEKEVGCYQACPFCGKKKIVTGVFERIDYIADYPEPQHPVYRPPYFYQIPLEFIPGLGKKMLDKLLLSFQTEMNMIHHVSEQELAGIVGPRIAQIIVQARAGKIAIQSGGGGIYGKLIRSD